MADEKVRRIRSKARKDPARAKRNVATRVKRRDYSKVLDKADQHEFALLSSVVGIDDEITLLRVKLRRLLKKEPDNIRVITATTTMLCRMVKLRHSMTDKPKQGLKEGLDNVFKEFAAPLGINAATEIVKRIVR